MKNKIARHKKNRASFLKLYFFWFGIATTKYKYTAGMPNTYNSLARCEREPFYFLRGRAGGSSVKQIQNTYPRKSEDLPN
jgi:hypothetical protein